MCSPAPPEPTGSIAGRCAPYVARMQQSAVASDRSKQVRLRMARQTLASRLKAAVRLADRSGMKKSFRSVLALACALAFPVLGSALPALYITPSDGFEVSIIAALQKKQVPVT